MLNILPEKTSVQEYMNKAVKIQKFISLVGKRCDNSNSPQQKRVFLAYDLPLIKLIRISKKLQGGLYFFKIFIFLVGDFLWFLAVPFCFLLM